VGYLPLSRGLNQDIRFLSRSGAGDRLIAPNDRDIGDGLLDGLELTVRAGHATAALGQGGTLYIESGAGGPGTDIAPPGKGGNLIIRAGVQGVRGTNMDESYGGSVYIEAAQGDDAGGEHPGVVLIGENHFGMTEEIRIGHPPGDFLNRGWIILTGHLANIHNPDTSNGDHTIRFASTAATPQHVIDVNAPDADNGNGLGIKLTTAQGALTTTGATAGIGGPLIIATAAGGAGSATGLAATGGAMSILLGPAGTPGMVGGGALGAELTILAGAGSGSLAGGIVSIGGGVGGSANGDGGALYISGGSGGGIGDTGSLYIQAQYAGSVVIGMVGGHITLDASTALFTSQIQQNLTFDNAANHQIGAAAAAAGLAGSTLTIAAGEGAAGFDGGTIYIQSGLGGVAGGNGGNINITGSPGIPYGGAVLIDGGAGSTPAGSGAVAIGTSVNNYRVQLGHTTTVLGFFGIVGAVRHSATGDTTGFVAGAGAAALADSTWAGASGATAYTVGDVVSALKEYGLLTL
jgi:hypothetical protein